MKKVTFLAAALLAAIMPVVQACNDDDDNNYYLLQPTALVTVLPQADGSMLLQLDDTKQLRPLNVDKSPYGDKEVRALVNYTTLPLYTGKSSDSSIEDVELNWIDSIRTKLPVKFDGADINKYGSDPLEIVKDWVTVAEDGYLTLRVRTLWGDPQKQHVLTLAYGQNPDEPLEFVLYQNANGDTAGNMGDALIAFNLNPYIADTSLPAKIKLKWKSFSGEKSAEFIMNDSRPVIDNSGSRSGDFMPIK